MRDHQRGTQTMHSESHRRKKTTPSKVGGPVHGPEVVDDAMGESLLCEVSWEVCQQLGGIYTVLRSKVPSMVKGWGERYCLVGPYSPGASEAEFEEAVPTGLIGQAVKAMQERGFEAHFGYWLITGRPQVILLNHRGALGRLPQIKYLLWEHHGISLLSGDPLQDDVVAFGFLVKEFFAALADKAGGKQRLIGHFHEWMGGTAIPEIRREALPVAVVFTTHATLLGRYLAMNDPAFYDHLPSVKWAAEAQHFNIMAQVMLERAAAHGAHVFTTVSDITAFECQHLLGRKPEVLLPNGLNIERFVALHEFQNLHREYKEKINEFVIGHFFPSYTFDLDRTLYFFTSGRYEYLNKGYNLTIEALARLNWRMKQARLNRTVVFFIITRQPYRGINSEVLRVQAVMEEMRKTCEAIQGQVGERLFVAIAGGVWPKLDDLVDDYWRLRLRRTLHAWKTSRLPIVVTHDLTDDAHDEVLNQLRACKLVNMKDDPVKVVYHPEFISSSDPLFGMDYDQFVRGCHLGVFPSYYEPWGYAPLECLALGLPSVTSDLTGFGTYVQDNLPDYEQRGAIVLKRRYATFEAAAAELAERMFQFAQLERRERIAMRNRAESAAEQFDWTYLGRFYRKSHEMALQRLIAG